MTDAMLPDTELYEVKRIDDLALVGVMYTTIDAEGLQDEYEATWNEPCYIAPTWIDRPQLLTERNKNQMSGRSK